MTTPTSTPPNGPSKSQASANSPKSFADMSRMTDDHQIDAVREARAMRLAREAAAKKPKVSPDNSPKSFEDMSRMTDDHQNEAAAEALAYYKAQKAAAAKPRVSPEGDCLPAPRSILGA